MTAFSKAKRLTLASLALAATVPTSTAWAQAPTWPNKPIRMVVGLAAGGLVDVLVRTIQTPLSEALGQPIVVDNRGGAGGNVAGTEVVRNGRDAHTFLVTTTTTESVNPSVFSSMPFDVQKDLQPVALLANSHLFLLIRPTLPVNTIKELVDYAKANPNTLRFGSAGNGTTPHLAGELLKQSANITGTHVPYKGALPALQDVMAGHIDMAFGPASVFGMVKSGKLKVVGLASRNRSPSAPEVPTFTEAGLNGMFADSMFGIYAPAGTPLDVIERMNRAVNRVLEMPAIKARFAELGAEALPMRPAEFKTVVQNETKVFTPIIKTRQITAD